MANKTSIAKQMQVEVESNLGSSAVTGDSITSMNGVATQLWKNSCIGYTISELVSMLNGHPKGLLPVVSLNVGAAKWELMSTRIEGPRTMNSRVYPAQSGG